jgi:hypothetical protein
LFKFLFTQQRKTMSLQELYSAANSLEPRDKAELAYNLLAALDAETDEDTTALWVEESERRFARYLEHGQSISARTFIAEMAVELGN